MKKTWIKIKRKLLDPKHRDKLGIRIWLYLYILDQADWDTGKIFEWRDKQAAEDMQMPWRTLQQQRQKLAEDGYISNIQKGDKQEITIHKWTNPREYSGELYNPTDGGAKNYVPMGGDTENYVPQGGTNEGTNEGIRKPSTLPIRSHITDQEGLVSEFSTLYENEIGPLTPMIREQIIDWIENYPSDWIKAAIRIAVERSKRRLDYVNGILKNWRTNGRDNGGKTKPSIDEELKRKGYVQR